jgi:CHAT domain-containing protein
MLNEDATAEAVLARCGDHRIIHLACHARFAESLPHASGLRFADRWASVREILDLSLNADCVVLAGCETGRTVLQPGDDSVGLPRAFLAAGARALLVSLWPVRDDAARAFMIDFHDRLPRRDGSLATLVRESMLARMIEQKHPAFWGAFGLVGADPWAKIASPQSAVTSVAREGRLQ